MRGSSERKVGEVEQRKVAPRPGNSALSDEAQDWQQAGPTVAIPTTNTKGSAPSGETLAPKKARSKARQKASANESTDRPPDPSPPEKGKVQISDELLFAEALNIAQEPEELIFASQDLKKFPLDASGLCEQIIRKSRRLYFGEVVILAADLRQDMQSCSFQRSFNLASTAQGLISRLISGLRTCSTWWFACPRCTRTRKWT